MYRHKCGMVNMIVGPLVGGGDKGKKKGDGARGQRRPLSSMSRAEREAACERDLQEMEWTVHTSD